VIPPAFIACYVLFKTNTDLIKQLIIQSSGHKKVDYPLRCNASGLISDHSWLRHPWEPRWAWCCKFLAFSCMAGFFKF